MNSAPESTLPTSKTILATPDITTGQAEEGQADMSVRVERPAAS
jgi:hypothetical protein